MFARRKRLWMLLLCASARSEEVLPTLLPTLTPPPLVAPTNLTAAELAAGEIAAAAAQSAGASAAQVAASAANGAGLGAAEAARGAGATEAQAEAAAARAAEAAAVRAGATQNEAARAAGDTAVEVSKGKAAASPAGPISSGDAWSLLPGTACLSWWGDGCSSITDEAVCLGSRDGSELAMTQEGVKTFGEPCVWCGGGTCNDKATLVSVCSPKTSLPTPLPAGFMAASCTGAALSSPHLWKKTVPEDLRSGGFQSRALNFEPMKNPGDEGTQGGVACRGNSMEDASNPNPLARNYYSTWTADLKECMDICSWKQDCTGVEYADAHNYCEVWNAPIQWVAPMNGYKCFRAMPPTNNASVGTVKWRSGEVTAEGHTEAGGLPTVFWVLGALIAAAVAVAICVVWRSRKTRRKGSVKRSVKTQMKAEGEETQPLVGTATPAGSSVPSLAGSFHAGAQSFAPSFGQNWYTPQTQAAVPVGSDGYGYSYGGAPDNGYLQQLRQWLQQYESARFQELAQLQNSQAPAWGHPPSW